MAKSLGAALKAVDPGGDLTPHERSVTDEMDRMVAEAQCPSRPTPPLGAEWAWHCREIEDAVACGYATESDEWFDGVIAAIRGAREALPPVEFIRAIDGARPDRQFDRGISSMLTATRRGIVAELIVDAPEGYAVQVGQAARLVGTTAQNVINDLNYMERNAGTAPRRTRGDIRSGLKNAGRVLSSSLKPPADSNTGPMLREYTHSSNPATSGFPSDVADAARRELKDDMTLNEALTTALTKIVETGSASEYAGLIAEIGKALAISSSNTKE